MNERIIKYIPKITHARTEYVEIDINDMSWTQEQFLRWLLRINELDTSRDRDIRILRTDLHERNTNLPKGKEGPNSIASFVSGMLENLTFGGQRDLTKKQMEAIEVISVIMASYFPEFTAIKFQVGFEL